MAYIDKWDKLFDRFCRSYPVTAAKVIDWYPSGRTEITVVLQDKTRVHYDGQDDTSRNSRSMGADPRTEDEWNAEFGRRLRAKLSRAMMSQKDLGEVTGISQSTISRFISGRGSPNAYQVGRLAAALKCSVAELVDFID